MSEFDFGRVCGKWLKFVFFLWKIFGWFMISCLLEMWVVGFLLDVMFWVGDCFKVGWELYWFVFCVWILCFVEELKVNCVEFVFWFNVWMVVWVEWLIWLLLCFWLILCVWMIMCVWLIMCVWFWEMGLIGWFSVEDWIVLFGWLV